MKYETKLLGEDKIEEISKERARELLECCYKDEAVRDWFDNGKEFCVDTPFRLIWTKKEQNMAKFEVGKTYRVPFSDIEVTVTKRTEKTIWVDRDGSIQWFMRIKHDKDGNEYAVDSSYGKKYRDDVTFEAKYGR